MNCSYIQRLYNHIFFISVASHETGTGRCQLEAQHAGWSPQPTSHVSRCLQPWDVSISPGCPCALSRLLTPCGAMLCSNQWLYRQCQLFITHVTAQWTCLDHSLLQFHSDLTLCFISIPCRAPSNSHNHPCRSIQAFFYRSRCSSCAFDIIRRWFRCIEFNVGRHQFLLARSFSTCCQQFPHRNHILETSVHLKEWEKLEAWSVEDPQGSLLWMAGKLEKFLWLKILIFFVGACWTIPSRNSSRILEHIFYKWNPLELQGNSEAPRWRACFSKQAWYWSCTEGIRMWLRPRFHLHQEWGSMHQIKGLWHCEAIPGSQAGRN